MTDGPASALPGELFTSTHDPLLGTRVSLRVRADNESAADAAEAAAIDEMDRLEGILTAFRPNSEWSRWRRGKTDEAGVEITRVLELAQYWHAQSDGAFHPNAGRLMVRWRDAERTGVMPEDDEMAALANDAAALPYAVDGGVVHRLGDCSQLDLHAIAKGWIVDQGAARAAATPGVHSVLLNAGGDLLHRGVGTVTAGIEDPRRPFDNVAPLTRIAFGEGGLATSSGARRGIRVGNEARTHVLDPRTGQPVTHVLAASALAGDAVTADVAATVLSVLPVADGLRFADRHGIAALVVTADGTRRTNAAWAEVASADRRSG